VQTRRVERGMWRLDRPPVTPVSADLTFQLTGVDRSRMVIGVSGLPAGMAVKSVQHDGRDITNVPTTFTGGAAASPITIVVTTRVAEPSIRVVDDQGNAVAQAHVVVFPADPSRWAGGWTAATARGGAVTLPSMPAGHYLVTALSVADFVVMSRNPDRIPDAAGVATRMTFSEGDRKTYEQKLSKMPPR